MAQEPVGGSNHPAWNSEVRAFTGDPAILQQAQISPESAGRRRLVIASGTLVRVAVVRTPPRRFVGRNTVQPVTSWAPGSTLLGHTIRSSADSAQRRGADLNQAVSTFRTHRRTASAQCSRRMG